MKELLTFWALGGWWVSCFEKQSDGQRTGIHIAYPYGGMNTNIMIIQDEGIFYDDRVY